MKMHRVGLIIALGGSSLFACGDDSSSDDKTVIVPAVGAGGMDAGAVPGDAARPDAGAVANDAGVVSVADSAVVDSGVRDGRVPVAAPDSAVSDSGLPRVDSGTTNSTPDSGAPNNAACLACAATECKAAKWPESELSFKECSDFGTETATTGMKAGTLRSKLCEDVLTCFQTTRCATPQKQLADGGVPTETWTPCLCGNQPYFECSVMSQVSGYKGVCRDVLLDAAETEDAMTFVARLANPMFAVGVATTRTLCQQRLCADECYAPCQGQADGTSCSGVGAIPPENLPPGALPNKQGTCQMQSCQDQLVPWYQSTL